VYLGRGSPWENIRAVFIMSFGVGRKRAGGWAWGSRSAPKKAKTVAAKVSRLQRQVALLKPEVKTFYQSISVSNVTQAAGNITYVSDVQQGTSDTTRVGDTIRPQYIRLRGQISPSGPTAARLMIVKDSDSNGVIPTIAGAAESIFLDFTARCTAQNSLTDKRFTVVYDRYFSTNAQIYGSNNAGYVDSGKIKLSGVSTFRANAGNNTDAGKNQYYFVCVVDDADTADINFRTELWFTDV